LKELTKEQKNNKELLSGCVAGALQKEDYLREIERTGFKVNILFENKEISKQQYQGIDLESLTLEATK
jgi:arsenite methyltransferase